MLLSIRAHGVIQIGYFVLVVISLSYLVMKFWMYNASPWRRIHFSAKIYYSGLLGEEWRRSQSEGREPQLTRALRDFSGKMLSSERREILADDRRAS